MSMKSIKRASGVRGDEPGTSKRRRPDSEEAIWQLRPDVKMSSIYNRNASEAPAELFRKDLISAMKLPDSEPLTPSEYWIITDTWKQDWERGVQVPVNPDSLPAPSVKINEKPKPPDFQEFQLPKDKYIHLSRDAFYQPENHVLSPIPARAEAACAYDLDASDTAWLSLLNAERARAGAMPINEDQLEKVIAELETRTWDKIQEIIKSEEGLGIEYDENVICDVCRSPDSEDGNEMVFCDSCNICVHQACYGITVIPDGQWLCRPCGDGARPTCVLCPNQGGAMKCTPSGHKWAHVSCVLWIPEVSIGCAEKMEPITKISAIPASRWSLVCVLCRERKGACIQCSVKSCKTAYHVTCAFKFGLEMRAIIEDENAEDGVKLRSYCQKHSVNPQGDKCSASGSDDEEVKKKRRKDMTSEEKTQARAARLHEVEKEFDRHISINDISAHMLDVDQDAIQYIYNYWKLKRRALHNRPLLPPKSDDSELLNHRQEQADLDKMKMFVQLRQDLERVRNLCYMVSRREKLSRSFFRLREQTFHKQVGVLSGDPSVSGLDLSAIVEANHGPSIYDRLYSHPDAPDHKSDFDELMARIAPIESGDDKKKDRNGLVKSSKTANPYKKLYVNGSRRSGSMYSGLSSEESAPEIIRSNRYRGRAIGSSTDDEDKKSISPKKKASLKTRAKRSPKKTDKRKKKIPQTKAMVDSSSEDDDMSARTKKDSSCSKTLQQMEKEMAAGSLGQSGTDSDELMPIRSTRNSKFPIDIYSDSSEDKSTLKFDVKPAKDKSKSEKVKSNKAKSDKSPSGNDSQQPLPRTKAAMKEFVPAQPEKKNSPKDESKPAPKKRGRKPSNKDKKPSILNSDDEAKTKVNVKFSKQKDNPTDLIVPQRQAAKKASENMRSTTAVKKEESLADKSPEDQKSKLKIKSKGKEVKDKDSSSTSATVTPAKVGRKKSLKDVEKETIAYVPQRQAAKKAAAHIKSGLGSKLPVVESETDKKKDGDKQDSAKVSPKKEELRKCSSKESTSSSSSSSSSCSSSSSSDEDEPEKPDIKPTAKAREIKPASMRQPSMFSPPGSRPTVDLPFLDKVSRPLSSTSASSDCDSSKESRGSCSDSPTPKRPRRRRKAKSISTDASPRKAPDKKLKTSERGSERWVSTSSPEREESNRPIIARAATRARTRSTTTSGNMPNKSDPGSRKSSRDDSCHTSGTNKHFKESIQSSEFSITEREKDKEIKADVKEEAAAPDIPVDIKMKTLKPRQQSVYHDDKDQIKINDTEMLPKNSPRKSIELRQKGVANRRMSGKEGLKDMPSPGIMKQVAMYKESRSNRHDAANTSRTESGPSSSPTKKSFIQKSPTMVNSKTPNDDEYQDDKHWLPKTLSPSANPPPVEKPGGPEKYMTEDKSMDSDSADKSSVKMIAKIQANLNENTMIKSPKTPMDARTMSLETIEVDNPVPGSVRKHSIMDADKKYINQDANNVCQGVEISKSAKIPSAVNQFQNRSIFSPQPKDTEQFDIDMLGVDDGFNHEDIMKPFTSYPEIFFKEDSKDQGAQETLNLVDRLRLQLNSKKNSSDNSAQEEESNEVSDTKDTRDEDSNAPIEVDNDQEVTSNQEAPLDLHEKPMSPKDSDVEMNHVPNVYSAAEVTCNDNIEDSKEYHHSLPMTSQKWSEMTAAQDPLIQQPDNRKYEHLQYQDDIKEPVTVQSDVQSVSEVADSISLSKQSDDSQTLSVVDHSTTSNEPELTQDNTYENNNSVIHSDCATISSPYVSQEWRESRITTRRSSASSTNSEGSICSQKTDLKSHMNSCDSHHINVMPEIDTYPPLPPYSCAIDPALSLNQYATFPPNASPFLSSLPFAQLPLPSPVSGLYAAGLPFPTTSLIQPKPYQLCAAFTSSTQNIALTTAMIAPPTPKPPDSPRDDMEDSNEKYIHVVSSPSISIDSYNDSSNTRTATKMSNDSSETMSSITPLDVKSSPKAKITMPKFPGKSPVKSPSVSSSPKQNEVSKGTKRPSTRNNRNQRGRGRSKSRGQGIHGFAVDYMGNSIQDKLVGTVYDFDQEIANDGVNLKALRDKRKSVDLRDDRKSEHSYKDSPSPRVVSPPLPRKRTPTIEKEAKPPSPAPSERSSSPTGKGSAERGPDFSNVQPVLPGPVDMRTYQPFENPVPVGNETYHSHLLEFASGTAEQQLVDIDEEVEKQLHSALMASKPRPGSPPAAVPEIKEPPKETFIPQLPKVSLSDSRNQLKVKIKGPFLDANYSASSVQPIVQQPPPPVLETNTNVFNTTCGTTSTMMSGSTNLRRMRKKELLRQYWTQDMNMDDPANASMMGAVPPPVVPPPLPRAVITIPKAVASMTSIPTREDYKFSESPVEKKKRKTTSGLSRELRHLAVSMNDDVDSSDDVKLSTYVTNSNQALKRRGRVSTKPNRSNAVSPVAPKLKIKIGSNIVQQVNEDTSGIAFRPPKKRLTSVVVPKPSLEDLRRESMKYRRMVMADFEENEKAKKHKPSKGEKRKRKKDKKAEKLQVINNKNESATKLIIKIKRTKDEEGSDNGSGDNASGSTESGPVGEPVDPFEYDPAAPDPLAIDAPSYSEASAMRKIRSAKVTPIRLKLSRSSQGSGYVMKDEASASTTTTPPRSPLPPPPPPAGSRGAEVGTSAPLPLAVSKHCEVR